MEFIILMMRQNSHWAGSDLSENYPQSRLFKIICFNASVCSRFWPARIRLIHGVYNLGWRWGDMD
jgi:hypothetical protein